MFILLLAPLFLTSKSHPFHYISSIHTVHQGQNLILQVKQSISTDKDLHNNADNVAKSYALQCEDKQRHDPHNYTPCCGTLCTLAEGHMLYKQANWE
jgi:hypothetical protein